MEAPKNLKNFSKHKSWEMHILLIIPAFILEKFEVFWENRSCWLFLWILPLPLAMTSVFLNSGMLLSHRRAWWHRDLCEMALNWHTHSWGTHSKVQLAARIQIVWLRFSLCSVHLCIFHCMSCSLALNQLSCFSCAFLPLIRVSWGFWTEHSFYLQVTRACKPSLG